jgi:serine/threonine-protein kinase
MLKCRECEEIINPDDIYCPYCGIQLKESTSAKKAETPDFNLSQELLEIREPEQLPADLPQQEFSSEFEKVSSEKESTKYPLEIPESISAPQILKPKEPIAEINPLLSDIEKSEVSDKTDVAIFAHSEISEQEEPQQAEHIEPKADRSISFEETIPYTPEDLKKGQILEPPEPFLAYHEIKDKVEQKSKEAPKEDTRLKPQPEDVKSEEAATAIETEIKSQEESKEAEKLKEAERSHVDSVAHPVSEKKSKLTLLPEGTVLANRYEIVKKIGGGGMGAVYLAKDRNLGGALRAVKEMIQSYVEEEKQEKAVNDFRREALLLSSLEHPSIPTIYDYFHDDKEGRFYLVMKYIAGSDLAAKLRSSAEGRIEEKTVVQWAIQITDVLDYLHNHQPPVIYRDLKPSNIMIDSNTGKVMLIDFGIARWVRREEKGVTAVGTMGYAPPELFSGQAEPRSDIYSLGATMFHLLTGADPQNNPLLIFDFTKNPRPRQINPTLSDQIEQIIMRAVEYKPEKRFSSAREMHEALIQHLQDLELGKATFGKRSLSARIAQDHMFCAFCGKKILATDLYCPFCGAQQAPVISIPSQKLEKTITIEKKKARLYVMNTEEASLPFFDLDKESILIGRRDPLSHIYPDVDLTKYDPQTKISRRHVRIWQDGDNFMIEDLGSSNGTVLIKTTNEIIRLLPRQSKILSSGDKIKLGDITLRFVIN